MKIPFYILGLLIRYGSQSGYSLKQIIERDISDFAKIKLPTIYYHLDKLKDKGYVNYITDKDGNRPEKQVCSITPEGKLYFKELFNKMLMENPIFEFSLDGILYFKDNISNSDLSIALSSKIHNLESQLKLLEIHKIKTLDVMSNEEIAFCAESIFDHHHMHIQTEIQWIKKVLKGLKK